MKQSEVAVTTTMEKLELEGGFNQHGIHVFFQQEAYSILKINFREYRMGPILREVFCIYYEDIK